MKFSILITLPKSPIFRAEPGTLNVMDEAHNCVLSIPCLGKADNQHAISAGNPSRDPKKSYGDTPTGTFQGRLRYKPVDEQTVAHYGQPVEYICADTGAKLRGVPFVHLIAVSGDGVLRDRAAGEQFGFDAGLGAHSHGTGQLIPTFGCVRVTADGRDELLKYVEYGTPINVTIREAD